MRILALGLVLGAATAAKASFDLMFLQANSGDAGTGLARVHRVDPQNGVALGSFNIGPTSYGMGTNGTRGELYTVDVNGNLRTWDYSAGTLKSFRSVGDSQVRDSVMAANGNEIITLHTGNRIRTTNVLTGSTYANTIGGIDLGRITVAANGTIFGHDITSGVVRRLDKSGTVYSLHSSEAASGVITSTNVGQMYLGESTNGYKHLWTGSTTGSASLNYILGSSLNFAGFGGFSQNFSGFANHSAFLGSHVGTYIVGTDSNLSTNVRITEMDPATYLIRTVTFSGINGGVRNAAVVLAPEPSSGLMLVAGAALLLRRRRG